MARINTTSADHAQHANTKSPTTSELQQVTTPTTEPAPADGSHGLTKIAVEIGGSHNGVSIRRPNGEWTSVTWRKGAGASGLGGVNVVPTMTALRFRDGKVEIQHGYQAQAARRANGTWHLFRYLKTAYAYAGSDQTESMEPALKTQQDIAVANGWDIHDIADKFFTYLLEEAVGKDIQSAEVWFNVVDYWPNVVAQRLKSGFEKILPGARIRVVNEVIASAIGAMERSSLEVSEPTSCLYVDCGDTTMNIATLTINPDEPRFDMHTYDTLDELGAGKINVAAENVVRELNEKGSFENGESRVWEILQFVDELFKIDPEAEYSPPAAFGKDEWKVVMEVLKRVNEHNDEERVNKEILNRLSAPSFDRENGHIVLQGLGARSITFLQSLHTTLSQFPKVKLHQDVFEEGSAVMAGLQCIADDDNNLTVAEAPLSLWMRSDGDDKRNDKDSSNDAKQAVRLCRGGQALNPSRLRENDRNPSHPIHFTLECPEGDPEIDLSVYGTRTGLADDKIMTKTKGRPPKGGRLAHAPIGSLTLFGQFQKELPLKHREDGTYHAYVFSQITRVGVTMLAVFAKDGHEMQDLDSTSVDLVVRDGQLMDPWRKHEDVELDLVSLGQVARPELSLQPAISANEKNTTSQKRFAPEDAPPEDAGSGPKRARRASMIL